MKSLVLFLLLSLNTCVWANYKDSISWSVSSSFSMTKMDFFTGIQAYRNINHWSIGSGIETGVNRTFFQQRFFPKIAVFGIYKFVVKPSLSIYALGNYAFSFCKFNQMSDSFHYWNEIYGGIGVEFGNRFRPFLNTSLGLLQESFRSLFDNEILKFNTLGFQGTIGLKYVF